MEVASRMRAIQYTCIVRAARDFRTIRTNSPCELAMVTAETATVTNAAQAAEGASNGSRSRAAVDACATSPHPPADRSRDHFRGTMLRHPSPAVVSAGSSIRDHQDEAKARSPRRHPRGALEAQPTADLPDGALLLPRQRFPELAVGDA